MLVSNLSPSVKLAVVVIEQLEDEEMEQHMGASEAARTHWV